MRASHTSSMALLPLFRFVGRVVRLSYGLAIVGLAGVVVLFSEANDGQRQAPLGRTSQFLGSAGEASRALAGEPMYVVVVRSDEQAAGVRHNLGNVSDYYGPFHSLAPTTFVTAETPREADLVRALLRGDPNRILIDLTAAE